MNIYDLISRAQKLRKETQLDSVSPDRVGGLHEDTLKYINESQLLASSPSLHKIYASVSAMQADAAPKSDLTGKALKRGQLVVIAPANQSDATAGDVYRYDGPSGNTSAWTFVAKIGAVPADAELSATSTNPPQNKVVTEKLTWFHETEFYTEEERATYEEGLLECYVDSNKMPNITELSMHCYVPTDNNIPCLYIRYQIANNEPVYLVSRQPFSNINNFEQFNLFKDGEFVGYVIFKDKQKFIDNPKGVGLLLNLNKVLRGNMLNGFSVTTEKINDDAVITEKIADKAVTTEKIENKSVTAGKTDFVEVKAGNQLYDATSMGVVGSWYYWKSIEGIGEVVALLTNQYTGNYTAIKIPINGLNKITLSQTGGILQSYYIVDDDMKALDFAYAINSYLSGYTIDIPSGAAYLLLSINFYNEEMFMANEGDVALPYEPYKEDTYINGIKITESTETPKEVIDLSLPDTIYAVVGDTLQLFYRGIVKAVNPYNYDILVTCAKGNQYPRYYEFTPTSADVGSIPFKVTIKDNSRNVIAEKSCTIKVVNVAPSPSSAKKIACFGDSLTAPGTWVAEAYRRLTSTGGTPSANGLTNIDFVGAKTKDGAGYFGVGGWSWTSYTTQGVSAYRFIVSNVGSLSVGAKYIHNGNTFTIMEINVTGGNGNVLCSVDSLTPTPLSSGTLHKSSGNGDGSISFSSYSQDSANPLWDYDNNKMTFIPYANKYADGKLDIVYTLLSWNGISAGMTDFSSIISKVKTFADTLHAEFPNAKLKIMGLQVPSVNGGIGANYGATGTSYADGYGMVETALNMNKAYQDFANEEGYADFVEFVNISSQFDSEYNMPYANTKVNTRSSLTEKRGNNGVHPSTDGYMQIADVVYRNLMFELRPQEIIYTRNADGTMMSLIPNLTQGQTITSITGVPYLTLYDEQGNNDIIYASQLPYSIKKTYVNWAAYVAGFPEFTMIVA